MDTRPAEGRNPGTSKADSSRDLWVELLAEIIVAAVRKEGESNA
jgi:hypothetical protein